MSRFDYVKYDDCAVATQESFKGAVTNLEQRTESLIQCPRSKAKAMEKLEEFYMWIGKGIRNDQIKTNKETELQEDRCNS